MTKKVFGYGRWWRHRESNSVPVVRLGTTEDSNCTDLGPVGGCAKRWTPSFGQGFVTAKVESGS